MSASDEPDDGFTRTRILRAVPLVGVTVAALVNGAATSSLGKKGIKYFDVEPRTNP